MKSLDLEAGDLDGDDALQDQVEVHLGSDGHLLLESDLDLQGDGGAVLDQDWEGGNGHHVKCDWFRAAICLKQKNLSHLKLVDAHRKIHIRAQLEGQAG